MMFLLEAVQSKHKQAHFRLLLLLTAHNKLQYVLVKCMLAVR